MAASARTLAALALALAPALAGCATLTGPSEGPCTEVTVPQARMGDRYAYDAEGGFADLNRGSLVDWQGINPDTDREQDWLTFPNGSTLRILVADQPEQRTNLYAETEPAVQATYWAHVPDEPDPAPFRDEWIDPDDGTMVQYADRLYRYDGDGGAIHFIWYQVRRQPALLGMPALWNRTLVEGETGEIDWPEYPWTHGWRDKEVTEHLRWTVTDVREVDGTCRAVLDAEVAISPSSSLTRFPARFVVSEAAPMPLVYEWEYPLKNSPDLRMELADRSAGDGDRLPVFTESQTETPLRQGTLATAPPEDGWVAQTADPFATSYQEALEATREDEPGGSWLADHPDAVVADVRHTPDSDPATGEIDRWVIRWADPDSDEGLESIVRRRYTDPLTGREEIVAGTRVEEVEDPVRPNASKWVTLGAMVHAYEQVYGEELRRLNCPFEGYGCHLGPPAPGSSGSGASASALGPFGLEVWLAEGWTLQNQATGQAGLGPPVR